MPIVDTLPHGIINQRWAVSWCTVERVGETAMQAADVDRVVQHAGNCPEGQSCCWKTETHLLHGIRDVAQSLAVGCSLKHFSYERRTLRIDVQDQAWSAVSTLSTGRRSSQITERGIAQACATQQLR